MRLLSSPTAGPRRALLKNYNWRRLASVSLLVTSLTLAWFGFGRYFLSLLLYAVPDLSFNWNSLTLPSLDAQAQPQSAILVIDKVKVTAPIIRDVPIDDQAAYDQALEGGVALARGSSPLEAATGNSFIFGHSSLFTFKPSPYDTVFALIPKLDPGDTFVIISGGQTATYKVTLSKQISAHDVQYLADSPLRQVTLVTCWPAGTNLRRWVVQATKVETDQVSLVR